MDRFSRSMVQVNSKPLINQLASQIVEFVRSQDEPHGMRLVERKLAEHLRVSRSPVRGALKILEDHGFVKVADGGGFYVDWNGGDLPITLAESSSDEEGDFYFKIASDRLAGELPDRITENELLRRYGMTRGHLAKVLRRITGEGWIERLPGHGWEFLPMLTGMQSYRDSYRFRLTIEPAAILEPTFELNEVGLRQCRDQQQTLVDGDIWTVSNADLFDMNSSLHETIIECSQNLFFVESLRRIDRVRRLIEYKQSLDRKYAIIRCREHINLVNLLLENKRQEASDYMRLHLSTVSAMKTAD